MIEEYMDQQQYYAELNDIREENASLREENRAYRQNFETV